MTTHDWASKRVRVTMTCMKCQEKGCQACEWRGWLWAPIPYPGGSIEIVCT